MSSLLNVQQFISNYMSRHPNNLATPHEEAKAKRHGFKNVQEMRDYEKHTTLPDHPQQRPQDPFKPLGQPTKPTASTKPFKTPGSAPKGPRPAPKAPSTMPKSPVADAVDLTAESTPGTLKPPVVSPRSTWGPEAKRVDDIFSRPWPTKRKR